MLIHSPNAPNKSRSQKSIWLHVVGSDQSIWAIILHQRHTNKVMQEVCSSKDSNLVPSIGRGRTKSEFYLLCSWTHLLQQAWKPTFPLRASSFKVSAPEKGRYFHTWQLGSQCLPIFKVTRGEGWVLYWEVILSGVSGTWTSVLLTRWLSVSVYDIREDCWCTLFTISSENEHHLHSLPHRTHWDPMIN